MISVNQEMTNIRQNRCRPVALQLYGSPSLNLDIVRKFQMNYDIRAAICAA